VTVGTGRDDPRGWVRAAYSILDVIERTSPGDKLPTLAQIAAESGVSRHTAGKACRELARRGLSTGSPATATTPGRDMTAGADLGTWLRSQRQQRRWTRQEMARQNEPAGGQATGCRSRG
jgi:DNA-binding transcriptional MocR family regulator